MSAVPLQFDAETIRCIMDAKMVLAGARREKDAVRQAAQTLDCSVFGPNTADPMDGADSETTDLFWTVLMVTKDWLDHKIPQTGDTVKIEGYPDMRVRSVLNDGVVIELKTRSAAF
jgi:hypothetical protein